MQEESPRGINTLGLSELPSQQRDLCSLLWRWPSAPVPVSLSNQKVKIHTLPNGMDQQPHVLPSKLEDT